MNLIKQLCLVLGLAVVTNSTPTTKENNIQKRIIGGDEVQPPNKYPFVGRIVKANTHRCGASLIDPYWVLTASHCLEGLLANEIKVEFGRFNLTIPALEEGATVNDVEFIAIHPQFDYLSDPYQIVYYHDISLMRLKNPIYSITPISLEKEDLSHSATGTPLVTVGWGRTQEGAPYPVPTLREVTVPIVDNEVCKGAYPGIDTEDTNICAGYDGGVLDACNGDSGDALFTYDSNEGKFYQVGIVSNGRGCALPYSYGTYTRVSSLLDFVNSTIETYTNPCSPDPCFNGGICNGFDSGSGKKYQCLCPVDFIGVNCETPVCSGSGCSIVSSGPIEALIEFDETKVFELTVSNFPANLNPQSSVRILTSTIDRYGLFDAIVTAPSGKQVTLEFFNTLDVGVLFDCYARTSWDNFAKNNVSECPASHLRPKNYIDFVGDDLNGKWTISITNSVSIFPHRQRITLVSWAVEVDQIQSCGVNVCQNGGTCLEVFGKQTCSCPSGALGDFCEYTPCSPDPCVQGKCSIDNGPRCTCNPGFSGRYCDKFSCPQGCLFGTCQTGGKCVCSAGWTGPSCSDQDVGNDGSAFCFTNNEEIYDGFPVPTGANPIETAVSASTSRDCAIETTSGGKSIIDVGYTVNDGVDNYCCRGKSTVGLTSPSSGLVCMRRDCEGAALPAGQGSATFSMDPTISGSSCYHSCVDASLSSGTCSSFPLFKGPSVLVSSLKKRAPGDSLDIAVTPSNRKDCLINSGQTLASGFTIQLDDGSRFCCSKGIFDLEKEECITGCYGLSKLKGRPFVMEDAVTGDACYASCYSIE